MHGLLATVWLIAFDIGPDLLWVAGLGMPGCCHTCLPPPQASILLPWEALIKEPFCRGITEVIFNLCWRYQRSVTAARLTQARLPPGVRFPLTVWIGVFPPSGPSFQNNSPLWLTLRTMLFLALEDLLYPLWSLPSQSTCRGVCLFIAASVFP